MMLLKGVVDKRDDVQEGWVVAELLRGEELELVICVRMLDGEYSSHGCSDLRLIFVLIEAGCSTGYQCAE